MPFFPNFMLRDLVGWLAALAILAGLAAFFPAELGEKADPFAPAPAGIKPEWYFMFMFQTLKYLPDRDRGGAVHYRPDLSGLHGEPDGLTEDSSPDEVASRAGLLRHPTSDSRESPLP